METKKTKSVLTKRGKSLLVWTYEVDEKGNLIMKVVPLKTKKENR